MTVLLLLVIYLVFISLGLPDGLLGSAWPAIYPAIGSSVGLVGIISLIVTSMTIISSLSVSFVTKKIGVGWLLIVSTLLTAIALFGYSQAPNIYWFFLFAVPLGLGAGAIDAALNHYVATHYKAHHMNWLHSFWGIGATAGPIIFASALLSTGNWHTGFTYVAYIQLGIVAVLLVSLPLWKKVRSRHVVEEIALQDISANNWKTLLRTRSVQYSLASFLLYVGLEIGVGLWAATYLVIVQDVSVEQAARWTGLFYAAITIGRLINGFVVMKVKNIYLIRAGIIIALVGITLLAASISAATSMIAMMIIGFGLAPIYPGMIHETPARFGKARSQKIISLQMAFASVGGMLIPPLIGLLTGLFSLTIFVYLMIFFIASLLVVSELLNRAVRK